MLDVATGNFYFYLNDNLGTPQMLTDSTGMVVWEGIYRPFGETDVNPNSTVENNFRFAGQYFDAETGYHYNYHRYYDPGIGRYLRVDPIGFDGGINLFAYAENNPVNMIDLFGLKTTITIVNIKFSPISITGTITAKSDLVPNSFSGVQIQDSKAGVCECKQPLADGIYSAFVRTDRKNRIEIRGTENQGLTNIQIHIANAPTVGKNEKLDGCIGPGISSPKEDWVDYSASAMQSIIDVINADRSGEIDVIVITPIFIP